MTQTADVPAREPASQSCEKRPAWAWNCGPRRCVPEPDSGLRRLTTASFLALKSRNPTPRCAAVETDITLCAEHAVSCHRELDFTDRCLAVSPCVTRTRARRARWHVRRCTDLGWFPPTLEGLHRMTNGRRTRDTASLMIRWQSRAVEQRGHWAAPRRWTTASFPGLRIK